MAAEIENSSVPQGTLAPIAVFAYNRPDHLRQTLEALAKNDLAAESVLYIYCDGPKTTATDEEMRAIHAVREVAGSRNWCRHVTVVEARWNHGLADSIVRGVTEVVDRHGSVIVLEDDISTMPGFLKFMNTALQMYESDGQVMHISGMIFGTPAEPKETTAFLKILSCHGWATWKRAWRHYSHDIVDLCERLEAAGVSPDKFNIEGGAGFYNQLVRNRNGSLYTWAVRWYASWLLAGGYSLFPTRSLLKNIGHDGSGTHAAASFYNGEMVPYLSVTKIPIEENIDLRHEIDRIWRAGQPQPPSNWKTSLRKSLTKTRKRFSAKCRLLAKRGLQRIAPEVSTIDPGHPRYSLTPSFTNNSVISQTARISIPCQLKYTKVGPFSYIAAGAKISYTRIGKFCSIGPDLRCGWGVHPLDGISSHPMFYSTMRQNGMTLSQRNKTVERVPIEIGNDVFIGMNVTILDGVTIGDGAVVGAGCVVSKDVPPYAVVVGCPMRILRYRFPEETVAALLKIRWWDWPDDKLREVEEMFSDVEGFIRKQGLGTPADARTAAPKSAIADEGCRNPV